MDFLFKKNSNDNQETEAQGDNSFSFKFSSGGTETGNVFSFLDRSNAAPPTQQSSGNYSFLFKDSTQPSTGQSESSLNTSGNFPFQNESSGGKSKASQPTSPPSLFITSSSLTPSKRGSNEMETSSDQLVERQQDHQEKEKDLSLLLKSPGPNFQPPTKKIKQTFQPEVSADKENVKPFGDEGAHSTLPFSPKKFSLSVASPIKASPPKSTEFSTPKKPLQPVGINRMTPPSFQLKAGGTTSIMQHPQTPTKSPSAVVQQPLINTPRPPINRGEEDNLHQSFERTEKFISKHRADLDEMKDVEQQLEGVKRKDTELSKTMEEINNKMGEYSDSLKTLTLKVTLLTNKMLMSQCPIINEKVEQIHLKYAHLINKTH